MWWKFLLLIGYVAAYLALENKPGYIKKPRYRTEYRRTK
jgi:hypothetical protein